MMICRNGLESPYRSSFVGHMNCINASRQLHSEPKCSCHIYRESALSLQFRGTQVFETVVKQSKNLLNVRRLRFLGDRSQASWLRTTLAGELKLGLPGTNPPCRWSEWVLNSGSPDFSRPLQNQIFHLIRSLPNQ